MANIVKNLIITALLMYTFATGNDVDNLSWMLSADLIGIRLSGFKGPTAGSGALIQQFNKYLNAYGGTDEIGLAEGYKILSSKKLTEDSVSIEVDFYNVVESIYAEKWVVKKSVTRTFVFVNGKIEVVFVPFVHPATIFRHYAFNVNPEYMQMYVQLRNKLFSCYPQFSLKE